MKFDNGQFVLLIACLFLLGCREFQLESPSDNFAELDAEIEAGAYGEINSLLIWQDDKLLMESYYRDSHRATMNQVYSVTKSITSAMIGKAVSQQTIRLEDPMLIYFPDVEEIENLSEEKERMTVADLLTMQSGFQWDELSAIYGSDTNSVTNLTRRRDWIKYVLDQPMTSQPGTTFTYNSGVTMLLGGILQQSTGESVEDYTAVNLFDPLEIENWQWDKTPQGQSNTGWGLHLQPIDMLKFGQLYLQGGEWEGEQLIPQEWVSESTQPLAQAGDDFTYGYQWWRFANDNPIVTDLAVNDLYFAWGFGGNFIFVVPHLELVVVSTAENFENSAQIFPVLPDYIFPEFYR